MQFVNIFNVNGNGKVNGMKEYINNRLKKIFPQENMSLEEVIYFFFKHSFSQTKQVQASNLNILQC